MIPFTLQPEPTDFDAKVRSRGAAFLASVPPGNKVDFRGKEYWRAAKDDLRQAFRHICAYTAVHVEEVTGADTVEHYLPKSLNANFAYEWANFRFVCSRMNGRKGTKAGVLDPFLIPHGLFQIDFPSMLVAANPTDPLVDAGETTIAILGLNDEKCTKSRFRYAYSYARAQLSMDFLAENAPLIHTELMRQGIGQAELLSRFS